MAGHILRETPYLAFTPFRGFLITVNNPEVSMVRGRLMMVEFVTAVTGLMILCSAVYGLIHLV
jgi:hypothetical protein